MLQQVFTSHRIFVFSTTQWIIFCSSSSFIRRHSWDSLWIDLSSYVLSKYLNLLFHAHQVLYLKKSLAPITNSLKIYQIKLLLNFRVNHLEIYLRMIVDLFIVRVCKWSSWRCQGWRSSRKFITWMKFLMFEFYLWLFNEDFFLNASIWDEFIHIYLIVKNRGNFIY